VIKARPDHLDQRAIKGVRGTTVNPDPKVIKAKPVQKVQRVTKGRKVIKARKAIRERVRSREGDKDRLSYKIAPRFYATSAPGRLKKRKFGILHFRHKVVYIFFHHSRFGVSVFSVQILRFSLLTPDT